MHSSMIFMLCLIQADKFQFNHQSYRQPEDIYTVVEAAPSQPVQLSTEGFDDWYQSVTAHYKLCKHVNFAHPTCPSIDSDRQSKFVIAEPRGELTSQKLLAAAGLYVRGKLTDEWLGSLQLLGRKPRSMDARLWAEAQYLQAQVLFDQKRFKESVLFFDKAVDQLKGKALFHQERAWALFFAGEIDRSLGSLFSAISPLLHPTPYFEKYFLRALIERELCQWDKAFSTINAARVDLQSAFYDATNQPFVKLCNKDQLGSTCDALVNHYKSYGAEQIRSALLDLDILEMEMQDRGVTKQKQLATSKVIWPYMGEAWQDEIGFYRVKLESAC